VHQAPGKHGSSEPLPRHSSDCEMLLLVERTGRAVVIAFKQMVLWLSESFLLSRCGVLRASARKEFESARHEPVSVMPDVVVS